jgi:glutathione S-transferase
MIRFYFAPWSRASATLWLLEELSVPYERVMIDIRAEGGVPEAYRNIQPNKKVPAVDVDGIVITERAAIATYLADRYPSANLAPAIDDPMRGPYLTMMVYADAVFDPAVSAKAQGWNYAPSAFSFGAFDDMIAYLDRILSERPFAAGERFTAADTQLASGLRYVMDQMDVVPHKTSFKDYLARCFERPAAKRAEAIDRELALATPFFQKMFAENG